jgi:5-formyltetrahydrofolate cyclo-ligase
VNLIDREVPPRDDNHHRRERKGCVLSPLSPLISENRLTVEVMTQSAKQILRQRIRQVLKSMSNEDRIHQSNAVTQRLLHHPKYLAARSISIYAHMQTEIATRDIIEHACNANKKIFIPRYTPTSMDMVRVHSLNDLDSLPITKWHIRQPAADDTSREVANRDIDLVIVPGLAFSLDGCRLGHGKGYYDKYLSALGAHCFTIGLASATGRKR